MESREELICKKYEKMNHVDGISHSNDYEKALSRYCHVKTLLRNKNDETGLSLLEELVDKSLNYMESISKMDISPLQRMRMETKDFQTLFERLDRGRRYCHDVLIEQLKITNRYLIANYKVGNNTDQVPVGGVYSLDPITLSPVTDRIAVGDWAGYLVLGIFNHKTDSEKKTNQ